MKLADVMNNIETLHSELLKELPTDTTCGDPEAVENYLNAYVTKLKATLRAVNDFKEV